MWWIGMTLATVAGVPALLNWNESFNAVRYYLQRPTEIGSLPAGLSLIFGWHASRFVLSYHSVNIIDPLVRPLSLAAVCVAITLCCLTWVAQARRQLPLEAAVLLTLTLVLLGSKVLSVQYVMWLLPFWALYRFRLCWLLAALANLIVFPYAVSAMGLNYLSNSYTFVTILTSTYFVRDLLIIVGTLLWARSLVTGRPSPERPGEICFKNDPTVPLHPARVTP
jgi:hypothetical protein